MLLVQKLTLQEIKDIMYETQIQMEAEVGGQALDAFERIELQTKQCQAIFDAQKEVKQ